MSDELDPTASKRAEKKRVRRLWKIRKGRWITAMNDEEWDIYVACCKQMGIEIKDRYAKATDPAPWNGVKPSAPNDVHKVVSIFGNNTPVDKGGVIPPPGRSDGDGDLRNRVILKDTTALGKRWSEIYRRIEGGEMTWEDFTASLTPEELARGQIMDKNGGFTGRPPAFVPRAFHDACIRELLARGKTLYKENYVKAIEAMTEIATSKTAKDADRMKAAQFVIERLEGKVPERVEISNADPWQQIIDGIVAEVPEEAITNMQDYMNRVNQPE